MNVIYGLGGGHADRHSAHKKQIQESSWLASGLKTNQPMKTTYIVYLKQTLHFLFYNNIL